jgi:hypothetical protein
MFGYNFDGVINPADKFIDPGTLNWVWSLDDK